MDQGKGQINIYHEYEENGEFANFYHSPIIIEGKEYATTEHYYQAMKFYPNEDEMEEVRLAPTPKECKRIARGDDDNRKRREDWDDVKDDIMYKCLMVKFTTHENLKKMLLETEDRELVEHTENDSYWGDGGDGSGKNMFGVILMKVRDEIRANEVKTE